MDLEFNSNKVTIPFSIIFDLDGTLIDSKESILNSIGYSLSSLGIQPKIPVSRGLIGPPLLEMLSIITGQHDPLVLSSIATKFKAHYDEKGWMQCIAYAGIYQLLKNLTESNCNLYIATNKRLEPTLKIIRHLGWSHFFKMVYCIDLNGADKLFSSKSKMISSLLAAGSINSNSAIYIGDRIEDFESANANNLRCILVDWGYSERELGRNGTSIVVSNVGELQSTLYGMK